MSLDGHDKFCGYQKAMFSLCIYGGQDTYSSRINFLRIWTSNNNPKIIGRFYLDYLYESRGRIILSHKQRIIGYPRVWPNFGVVKMMNSTVYIVNGCGLLPCFLP